MLIDLKAHYLDLITQAIEAAGNACLHRQTDDGSGSIYATRSETDTRVEFVLGYSFTESEFMAKVVFADERPTFFHKSHFVEGIGGFFEGFAKALVANRLTVVNG